MTKININELEASLRPKEKKLYDQICALLNSGKTVRAYGSGHSNLDYSPIFNAQSYICMADYIEEPYLEKNNILVVSPGMSLDEIRKFLAKYNLRLYGTPESKSITIGGAILFGAHNGTGHWDCMAHYVQEMLLIDGKGEALILKDPQLFINYGLLGIVLQIKIKVFSAINHKWTHTLFKNIKSFDDIKITDSTYCLFFGPYSNRILKADINLTEKLEKRNLKRLIWDFALWPLTFTPVAKLVPIITYLIPQIGIFASEIFTYEPDVIRNKFDYFEPVPKCRTFTLEYAINIEDLEKAYYKIMSIISYYRKKGNYVLRFWSRFQKATENVNDLSYNRTTALVEVTINDKQKFARQFVNDISDVLLELGGKPHLAKTVLRVVDLKNYDFKLLQQAIKTFDPKAIFQNKFTKEFLK